MWQWWSSGDNGDTLFTALFSINPFDKMPDVSADPNGTPGPHLCAASSLHPGWANFAFADGSVRFLPETIDSWVNDPRTCLPPVITFDGTLYRIDPRTPEREG